MAKTLAGELLRAVAVRDAPTMTELTKLLDGDDWTDAEPVFAAGFEIVVSQRFSPDQDVREISAWVRHAVAATNAQNVSPVLETEAVIRKALGERVAVSDIPASMVNTIRLMVVAVLVRELEWSNSDIDAFVDRAEAWAMSRGARPTPN
jgi:hypothetical protein